MIIVAAIFTDKYRHKVVIQKLRGDKIYFFRAGDHQRTRVLTRKQFLLRYHLAR